MDKFPLENLNQRSIESERSNLAEQVKSNLEKHKDQIKDLAISTSSAKNGNGFNTTKDLAFATYKEDYDADYEVKGSSKENAYSISSIEEPTYIYHNKMNWISFYTPLGRNLHTPDRPGNMLNISMKGEKGAKFSQELINSIFDLIKTIKIQNTPGSENILKDLKEIAREVLPVLRAFKETADRFQTETGSHFTIQQAIDEYEEILQN